MKIFFNESTKILSNSNLSITKSEDVNSSESLGKNILKIKVNNGTDTNFETVSLSSEVVDVDSGFIFKINNSFSILSKNYISDDIKNVLISKHKNFRDCIDRDTEFLFEIVPTKKLKI